MVTEEQTQQDQQQGNFHDDLICQPCLDKLADVQCYGCLQLCRCCLCV